jgi:hypothetical protein
MIRVGAFLIIILLVGPAVAAKVTVTYCAQAHEIASARLKWALARQHDSNVLQDDNSCRVYRSEFYEAAVTRQSVTQCEQDDVREHALLLIDDEINAFNDLIATRCGE